MRRYRGVALGASVLVLLISACTTGGSSQSPTASQATKPKIIVGSANFYESTLVAEMYAQALEAKGYTVERKLVLGPRKLTNDALKNGQLNLMPEYIGSDARELKANSAIAGVLLWNLADAARPLGPRQTRKQLKVLLKATGMDDQMKVFGLWDDFVAGRRGRAEK